MRAGGEAGMLALAPIEAAIERCGLVTRGALPLADADRTAGLAGVAAIVLVGAAGTRGWQAFAASSEARDGLDDPLDRWSRRIIDDLAAAFGARPLYPFGGPPHWPFQRWAMRAEPLFVSPLGMLIHPDFGLWHSYRGALAFSQPIAIPPRKERVSPCEACLMRPCLTACPVGAFTIAGYDVAACASHLRKEGNACTDGGCLARRACPVGAEHAHGAGQMRFHMRAFLAARCGCFGVRFRRLAPAMEDRRRSSFVALAISESGPTPAKTGGSCRDLC
jgi:ferredoxin